jgi:hypothetical protein
MRSNALQNYTALTNLSLRCLGSVIRNSIGTKQAELFNEELEISAAALLLQLLYVSESEPTLLSSFRTRGLPPIISAIHQGNLDVHNDLKVAMLLSLMKVSPDLNVKKNALQMAQEMDGGGEFKDNRLVEMFGRLSRIEAFEVQEDKEHELADVEEGGPRKRRKLVGVKGSGRDNNTVRVEEGSGNGDVVSRLFELIGSVEATSVTGLSLIVT